MGMCYLTDLYSTYYGFKDFGLCLETIISGRYY